MGFLQNFLKTGYRDGTPSGDVSSFRHLSEEQLEQHMSVSRYGDFTLTDAIKQERGIASSAGALVYRISERIRDEIGLQEGDVIAQVGQNRINTAEAASTAIERYGARGPVFLVFERNRQYYQTSFYLR